LRGISQLLANDVAEVLRQAVHERGRASLAVPGGTTPREFITFLGQQDLPWSNISVLPTDERNVPRDAPRSNERMIRECLSLGSESFMPLHAAGAPFDETVAAVARCVDSLGPIDAVVVGMGTDGHIASLFPGDRRLERGVWKTLPAVLAAYPTDLESRLSLAPLPLMRGRWKALLIAGQDKLATLFLALGSTDPLRYPVHLLFEDGVPPRVYCAD
jgi:6-phosphogluconolactonase